MTTKIFNYDLDVKLSQDDADPADNRAMDEATLKAKVEAIIRGIFIDQGRNNIRTLTLTEK